MFVKYRPEEYQARLTKDSDLFLYVTLKISVSSRRKTKFRSGVYTKTHNDLKCSKSNFTEDS